MKSKLILSLVTTSLIITSNINVAFGQEVLNVKKYSVDVSNDIRVEYSGPNKELFKNGFKTGFGSAIAFKGVNENNEPEFYALTDRGPNGDSPNYKEGDKENPSKFFQSPSFNPSIGVLTLKKDRAYVDTSIEIKNKEGKKISGLPLEPGKMGSTGEVALDMDFNRIGYDNEGVDTEGISVDKKGNIWVCDEYGPFLMKLNPEGKILEKYAPKDGLPDVLKYRIPNRGFEGLTITPSGKVIVALQSVLDVEGETKNDALFTRIVEFDPQTKKSKMYAYPIETNDYNSPKDCKIGDIYAVDDNTILIIEQGKDKEKNMKNYIYKVNLSKASDISNIKHEGKELEYVKDKSLIKDVNFAKKELLVDLRANGWTTEKAEGITMLPDKKTIVVINDNDFEIGIKSLDEDGNDVDIADYTYDTKTKQMSIEDEKSNIDISMAKNNEESEVWTIELKDDIDKNNPIIYVGCIGTVLGGVLVYLVKKIKNK